MSDEHIPWYMTAIFYKVHIRAYWDSNNDGKGDIPGLNNKLDYIKRLGVDCIWILPVYPSPLKDAGYDIADYYDVHQDYGTLVDFKRLIEEAHKQGLRFITDFVRNHTSDQHIWFQKSRTDPNSNYRDDYVWSETEEKYTDARIIFLDTKDSNWTYDEEAGFYFRHCFYSSQPDLNCDNPRVREEMLNGMNFWLQMGIDGFRADAVPYLIEREGSNCENLPETHQILKDIRAYLDANYQENILLAEASQKRKDIRPYFGQGDGFHMEFHFPAMPQIFMALRKGDDSPIHWIMAQTPKIPPGIQWCTFLRNHDDLTLEMVTGGEQHWMWSEYAPLARMHLNLGIRRRLAPLMDNNHKKFLLAYALLSALPCAPFIYYGDEIGMGDNIWLPERNGVCTPMQWHASSNARFSKPPSDALYAPFIDEGEYAYQKINISAQEKTSNSLLDKLRHLITVRKEFSVFPLDEYQFLPLDQTQFLLIHSQCLGESILCIQNLSDHEQEMIVPLPEFQGQMIIDIIENSAIGQLLEIQYSLILYVCGFAWLKFIENKANHIL